MLALRRGFAATELVYWTGHSARFWRVSVRRFSPFGSASHSGWGAGLRLAWWLGEEHVDEWQRCLPRTSFHAGERQRRSWAGVAISLQVKESADDARLLGRPEGDERRKRRPLANRFTGSSHVRTLQT